MKSITNPLQWRKGVLLFVGVLLLSACNPNEFLDLSGSKHKKIQLLQLDMNLLQLRVDTQSLLTQNTRAIEQFETLFNLVATQVGKHQAGQNESQLLQQWQRLSVLKEDLSRRRRYFLALYQGCADLTEKINLLAANIDELAAGLVATQTDQELIYQVTRMLFITERMQFALAIIKLGHGEEQAAVIDRLGRDTVMLTKQIDTTRWLLRKEDLTKSQINPLLFRMNKLRAMNQPIHAAVGGTMERAAEFISYLGTVDELQKTLAEMTHEVQRELQML